VNATGRPAIPEAVAVWHAFLVRKVAQRVTDLGEQLLAPEGLTLRHFGVLSLVEAEAGHTQRAIGDLLRIDRTSIMLVVDELERDALVERRPGANRRMYALHITARGRARLRSARKVMAQLHEEFLAPLSPAERDTLRSLLARLAT
jgi:MarR family transcriptional regulator, lower aerobic nicotinate degradation pathway regulator